MNSTSTVARVIELVVASILGVAVVGKLLVLGAEPQALNKPDLVIRLLTNRQLLTCAVLFEIAIIIYLINGKSVHLKNMCIASLGLVFIAYHIGLANAGAAPCSCLGTLHSSFGLTREDADRIAVIVAVFMTLVGVGEILTAKLITEHPRSQSEP